MGYLDEAIRDHLELRRKRGVPTDEIERAEAEALGPIGLDTLPEPVSERATAEADADADADAAADDTAGELEAEPEATAEEPVAGPAEPLDQPTQAFTAVDAAEAEGESVLDETPDFLQETPEHDRLWFEQKPPKDFDFS